jgi:hypothetical protein
MWRDSGDLYATALEMDEEKHIVGYQPTERQHLDFAAAAERGIRASNTPVVSENTADPAMALLLATCRCLSVCERPAARR